MHPKNIRSSLLALLPFILLTLFIMLTDPYRLPIFLIPVPLALLSFGVFGAIKFGLQIFHVPPSKSKILAGLVTSALLLIVLLQSIGQLHLRDFLILAFLVIGLAFYLQRYSYKK